MLSNDDRDADTEPVSEILVYAEPDNVAVVVEVIEVSGDVEIEADAETDCDGIASVVLEDVGAGEKLAVALNVGGIHNNLFHSRSGKQRAVTLREVHAGPTVVLGHHVLEEAPHVDGTTGNVEDESE